MSSFTASVQFIVYCIFVIIINFVNIIDTNSYPTQCKIAYAEMNRRRQKSVWQKSETAGIVNRRQTRKYYGCAIKRKPGPSGWQFPRWIVKCWWGRLANARVRTDRTCMILLTNWGKESPQLPHRQISTHTNTEAAAGDGRFHGLSVVDGAGDDRWWWPLGQWRLPLRNPQQPKEEPLNWLIGVASNAA